MPKKRDRGLTWLDESDLDQIEWAANYLQARRNALLEYSRRLNYERLYFMDLIQIGDDFERRIEGGGLLADSLIKLLQDMKGAARAAKARKKQKESGARKIKIGSEASNRLEVLAKLEAMSEEAFLEKLIEHSYKTKKKQAERKGAQRKPSIRPPIPSITIDELQSNFRDRDHSPHPKKTESPISSPSVDTHIEEAKPDKGDATEASSVTSKSTERDTTLDAEAAVFLASPDDAPVEPLSENSDSPIHSVQDNSLSKMEAPLKSTVQEGIMNAMRAKTRAK